MRLGNVKKIGTTQSKDAFRLPVKANENIAPPGGGKAPKCPHCSTMTLWYESHVQRDNGRSKVIHSFHCPNCAAVVQIEAPYKQALRVVS